jgi:hemerythrin-like metal-binding protein
MTHSSPTAPLAGVINKNMSYPARALLLYLLVTLPVLCAIGVQASQNIESISWGLWLGLLAALYLVLNSYIHATHGEITLIQDNLEEMAVGNLNIHFDNEGDGAGSQNLESLQFLHQELVISLESTRRSSDWIGALGQQIFSNSQHLDQNTKQQESELTQAASAITEMTASVQEVSNLTRQGVEVTESTLKSVRDGQVVFSKVMDNIRSLESEIRLGAQEVNRLEEDSRNIQSVLDSIRGIAEQTNLLALNAAIEAARAGEQGRGFAVVADEVRQLAKRTEEATTETRQMIERMQRGVVNVVALMEGHANLAADTIQSAGGASDAIEGMAEGMQQISDFNIQIAAATKQQYQASEEMNRNICELSQQAAHISQNARSVFETAAKVSTIGGEIRTLTDRFDLRPETSEKIRSGQSKFVEFSGDIDVEIDEINRQHMKIIELANELYRISSHRLGLKSTKRILMALIGYTQTHFRYEEAFMGRYGYPETEEHRAQHLRLEQQVVDYAKSVDRGEVTIEELLKFLKSWLVFHIQGTDRKYTPHFHSMDIH